MHNEHWLTSTAFSPFGAPWTNEVTKGICRQHTTEHSVRMQLSRIAHVSIAYFAHASGMILYAMAIEHVELRTCRVPGSTTNANRLCARARRQLPRPLR